MKYIDISMEIRGGMLRYTGDPDVEVSRIQEMKRFGVNMAQYSFASHTGTHFDAPAHLIDGGKTAQDYAANYFFGKTKVFEMMNDRHILLANVSACAIDAGDIVLFKTNGSALLSESAFREDHTALMPEAAQYLADRCVKAVGIDYLSIDRADSEGFPSHKILLGAEIPIIEGVDLSNVPQGEYDMNAMFLRAENPDGAPLRAVLIPRGVL